MKNVFSLAVGLTGFVGLSFCGSALAGEAVSGFNGKIGTTVGVMDSDDVIVSSASASIPLAKNLGVQLDGLLGGIDARQSNRVSGGGVQAFWRDSEVGLLGISASVTSHDSFEVNRGGLVGEYYINNFTLIGQFGKQGGDIDDSEYANFSLKYYPFENLFVGGRYGVSDDDDRWNIKAEFLTPMPGVSLFVDFGGGERDYDHVVGGFRVYMGSQKSLIRRHREDDPDNDIFYSVSETYSEYEFKKNN